MSKLKLAEPGTYAVWANEDELGGVESLTLRAVSNWADMGAEGGLLPIHHGPHEDVLDLPLDPLPHDAAILYPDGHVANPFQEWPSLAAFVDWLEPRSIQRKEYSAVSAEKRA